MRSTPVLLLLAGFMLLLDFYVFQIVKTVSHSASPRTRSIIFITYWVLSVLALVVFLLLPLFEHFPKGVRSTAFSIVIGLFLCKLIASVFFLIDDLRRGIQWLSAKLFFSNTEGEEVQTGDRMSRSLFLSWAGIAVGSGLYTSLLFGFSNKYNYKVKNVALNFSNLPPAFKGLKIVQISDIHAGSFTNKAEVAKGVDKILALKPDVIFFTGDLVNNTADEMLSYMDVFSRLKAPMGVYSIFGNHDYADYIQWNSAAEKSQNLEELKTVHAKLGWRLLLDENVVLQKANDKIALIGVQNWSALKRFPKYGNLTKAYEGSEAMPFKILLSHDPTHWDAEVRPKFPDIDLTLSGHTHGMQFGLEIPWLRWSPVQYVYKQWMGLYQEGNQHLYINRGYGFIGYPGRVGILPEITLIQLT